MPTSVPAKFIELLLGNMTACNYVSFDHTQLTLSPQPVMRLLIIHYMGIERADRLCGVMRLIRIRSYVSWQPAKDSTCLLLSLNHVQPHQRLHVTYTAGNVLKYGHIWSGSCGEQDMQLWHIEMFDFYCSTHEQINI